MSPFKLLCMAESRCVFPSALDDNCTEGEWERAEKERKKHKLHLMEPRNILNPGQHMRGWNEN